MHKKPINLDDKKKILNYFEKESFILGVEGTKEKLASEGIDINNDYVVDLDNSADKEGIEYRIYFNKDDKFENLNLVESDIVTNKQKEEFSNTINRTELGRELLDKGFKIGRNNC